MSDISRFGHFHVLAFPVRTFVPVVFRSGFSVSGVFSLGNVQCLPQTRCWSFPNVAAVGEQRRRTLRVRASTRPQTSTGLVQYRFSGSAWCPAPARTSSLSPQLACFNDTPPSANQSRMDSAPVVAWIQHDGSSRMDSVGLIQQRFSDVFSPDGFSPGRFSPDGFSPD